MTDSERDAKKKDIIKSLYDENHKGIVGDACALAGISRQTYKNWKDKDPAFKEICEESRNRQKDNAEQKLLELINKGNVKAIIFYLKTRCRDRGYGEKYVPDEERKEPEHKVDMRINGMFTHIRTDLIQKLKKAGLYDDTKDYQIEIAASVITKLRLLRREMFDVNHHTIITERSREGNKREVVSPLENQFKQYLTSAQAALRALGLNTDTRQKVETDGDDMKEFYSAMDEE